MKKSLLTGAVLLLCIFSTVSAWGGAVVFRGGEVLAAESSSRQPAVANLPKGEKGIVWSYVLVTVRVTQGRGLSIEDFSLGVLGGNYPCIAIRENDGRFDAAQWQCQSVSAGKKYGMLFRIPAQDYKEAVFSLVCNAPGKWTHTRIPVRNIGNAAFTAAGRVPAKGSL